MALATVFAAKTVANAGVLKIRGCGAFSVAQLFIPKGYQTLAGG